MQSFINRDTPPFPKNYISITRNLCFPSLYGLIYQNVLISPQLSMYSCVHQRAILYCLQHTKLLYTIYRLWCCLICTYHMDWPQTPVISESLSIYHTIIAQTPSNHINLSIVLGILPSRHYPFTHFPLFWVHLTHDVHKSKFYF